MLLDYFSAVNKKNNFNLKRITKISTICKPEMSIAAEKLPLPHRDARKKKLPRRCRTATLEKKATAPLPQWFSKKCSKFHCRDCIGPEILVLDH
jgi:hypothetical protein